MSNGKRFRRDLFEIENARNLTRDDLVSTFVPTKAFWRLLSAKNHIVLGSRGSGKTTLAKMLSHDRLCRLRDERARHAIATQVFIGIYVPTSIEWVGGLKNKPWQTEREAEEFFQWRLNVATCLAFLIALRSRLDCYVSDKARRAQTEAEIVEQLSRTWSSGAMVVDTLRSLQNYLEDVEHRKQQQLTERRVLGTSGTLDYAVGLAFDAELFSPLRRGMTVAARALALPEDAVWTLALDEAEFLNQLHHRILNTHLRAASGNLVFKITTMPYFHRTLDTNTGVPLNVGHDFEYVYIDQDPVILAGKEGEQRQQFASMLFAKRAEVSGPKYRGVKLRRLLGPCILLEPKANVWTPNSSYMSLLQKHASRETRARADWLLSTPAAFMDQLGRKLHSALLLREAVSAQRGRKELDLYSGDAMVVRCGDANPRRLIRIFNSLLLEVKWKKPNPHLTRKAQTRILTAFSTSMLVRVQSEPECGPELFILLKTIGNYMHASLHKWKLTTDQVSSIVVDQTIGVDYWRLVQRAVGLGLLYPKVGANNPDQMPEREGTFHLAYVLAPHFRIVSRRGKARKLSTVLAATAHGLDSGGQQRTLFEDTEESVVE